MTRLAFWATLLLALGASCAFGTSIATLSVLPGDVVGYPGQTVGWGFQISNTDSTDWIVVTGSAFCHAGFDPLGFDCTNGGGGPYVPYDGTTQYGTSFGPYTDYAGQFGIVLAPFESGLGPDSYFSFPFSPGNPGTGIGQYAILPTATPGVDSGNIFILYDIYDGNPAGGGNFLGSSETPDPSTTDPSMENCGGTSGSPCTTNASVTVIPLPEPATFSLVGGALVLLGAGLRKRLRRS